MATKPKPMPDDQTAAGVRQIIKQLEKRKNIGTKLSRRRTAEALERYKTEWLPPLEKKEAEEAYQTKQRQISENCERFREETQRASEPKQSKKEVEDNLRRIAGHPVDKQPRKVFHFPSDDYYFRGAGDALVPAKIKRLPSGHYVDEADGELLEVVETFPSPTRGAMLLDSGDWRLPEAKQVEITPPARQRTGFGSFSINYNRQAAERTAEKIRKLGYQATVGSADDKAYVLYDERWIGVSEWQARMQIQL